MRLTLRQLQIFLAVAQSGSTTAAAGAVSLSQSATSAALNELESVLNVPLFDRVGKRLVLNESGRMLLPQARKMLDLGASIEQQFLAEDSLDFNGLNIGASTTIGIYLLPIMLAKCSAGNAGLPPCIAIANTADVVKAVANLEVDAAFIEGPSHNADLQVEPWIRDELIIVCAPDHALVKGKTGSKISVKSLRQAGWLLREAGSGTREAVEQALIPHLHGLNTIGEFSNSEAIKYAAAEGLGIACMSRWVVQDLIAAGRLVEVNTTLPRFFRNFYLVYSKHKALSARIERFLEFSRGWRP